MFAPSVLHLWLRRLFHLNPLFRSVQGEKKYIPLLFFHWKFFACFLTPKIIPDVCIKFKCPDSIAPYIPTYKELVLHNLNSEEKVAFCTVCQLLFCSSPKHHKIQSINQDCQDSKIHKLQPTILNIHSTSWASLFSKSVSVILPDCSSLNYADFTSGHLLKQQLLFYSINNTKNYLSAHSHPLGSVNVIQSHLISFPATYNFTLMHSNSQTPDVTYILLSFNVAVLSA